jgi:RNA polymerase sigma-70 factor, ECF subfamily
MAPERSAGVEGSSDSVVSQLLKDWGQGDESALDKLIPLVYEELRKIAHYQMARERAGHTLQTTALVNEACLRFLGGMNVPWQDRAHFMALSAQLMRRILVDHARGHGRAKRGGALKKLPLEESLAIPVSRDADFEKLDDALNSLAAVDERKAKTVELRYFGGFSVEETSKVLHVSVRTVMSDWKFAKVWLLREMQRS